MTDWVWLIHCTVCDRRVIDEAETLVDPDVLELISDHVRIHSERGVRRIKMTYTYEKRRQP